MAPNSTFGFHITTWDSRCDSTDQLLPVLTDYYGEDCTAEWCGYKFGNSFNPTVASLAIHEGETVGIAAAGLRQFIHNGSALTGTISLATFVKPEHRGKGVYPLLLEALESLATGLGASFLSALPNTMSQASFAKAGYTKIADSNESIFPSSIKLPFRAVKSVASVSTFQSNNSGEYISDESLEVFKGANDGSPYIQSSLSLEFLSHRLSASRGNSYSIVNGSRASAILMHGTRGEVHEARILATSPRNPDPNALFGLYCVVRDNYLPDLITTRFTSPVAHRLSFANAAITRRAAPPLYVRKTRAASLSFSPSLIRFTGIDTHTW